jgi:hypothetical protein
MGSIPGARKNGKAISSYSPDGVAIIDANIIYDQLRFNAEADARGKTVVLFEFKCPRRRTPNGKVPKHYLSQPKKGMCILPMCSMGIFGDAMFRKCSIADFNLSDSYDKSFHDCDKYARVATPIVLGMVGFYENATTRDWEYEILMIPLDIHDPDYPDPHKIPLLVDYLYNLYKPISNSEIIAAIRLALPDLSNDFVKMISHCIRAQRINEIPGTDFGNYHPDFEDMVEQVIDVNPGVWYPSTFATGDPKLWLHEQFKKFDEYCIQNQLKPIGVMPWKLFKIFYTPIPKDPDYLNKLLPEIEKIVSGIQEVYQGKSIDDIFPKTSADHLAYKKYSQKYKAPAEPPVVIAAEPILPKSTDNSWFTDDDLLSIQM